LLFSIIIQKRVNDFVGTNTPTDFQAIIASGTAEQLQALLANVKILTISLIIGLIVLTLVFLFSTSLSRMLIWLKLTSQKFNRKRFWRWNLLMLVILPILLIIMLLLFTLKMIILYPFSLFINDPMNVFWVILSNILTMIVMLITLYIFFATNLSFVHSNLVWKSIGDAFGLLRKKIKKLPLIILYQLVIFLVLSASVSYLLLKIFPLMPFIVTIFHVIIFLLFISWARIYFYNTVKE
ncbi:MAG: hypothetical protein KJ896_02150, partial [Nanoarchaeota archaeon]|nr:hypothetical protein [Nanoarchaeota archaeon]